MSATPAPSGPLAHPPYATLRERVLAALGESRDPAATDGNAGVRRVLDAWWAEQGDWDARLAELLRLHHDINNALVGVSGNIQLMLRDPVSNAPGVRERLDVMMRECGRIQAAAVRLRELRAAFQGGIGDARAA